MIAIIRLIKTRLSSRQLFASLIRLALTELLALGVSLIVINRIYYTYWNQTVVKVQTVDFNILSHTLPSSLSYAMIQDKPELIQQILDSNYGLFGLVLTDQTGRNVIAYSRKNNNRHPNLFNNISIEKLQDSPYDLLLDPPPIAPQGIYQDPDHPERIKQSFQPQGEILGRVYYVRVKPPDFSQELSQWLRDPLSNTSRFYLYNFTIFACFLVGLSIWGVSEILLFERFKMIQQSKDLKQEAKLLRARLEQNKELNLRRIHQEQTIRDQLESEREKQQKRVKTLQEKIRQYESQLKESQQIEEDLELQIRVKEELDNKINVLGESIQSLEEQNLSYQQRIDHLKQANSSKQKEFKSLIEQITQEKEEYEKEKKYYYEEVLRLETENQQLETESQQLKLESQQLKTNNKQLETERLEMIETNNQLLIENAILEQEIEHLNQTLTQQMTTEESSLDHAYPMSKMPKVSSREVVRTFKQLGYSQDRQTGSHIIVKKEISISIPHHQAINPVTLKNILQQAKISLEEFLDHL